MNGVIKTVLCAAFSGIVGGGIVYLYLNKRYDEINKNETEDYINEISDLKKQINSLQKQVVNKLDDEKSKLATSNPYKDAVVIDPDQISMDDIIDESEDEDERPDIDSGTTISSHDIRYISVKDYDDDEDYEKEEIKYFSADGVITQDDEILEAEEFIEVCGKSALLDLQHKLDLSGRSGGDRNCICVRNENYDTDYKITRINSSYQKYITKRD